MKRHKKDWTADHLTTNVDRTKHPNVYTVLDEINVLSENDIGSSWNLEGCELLDLSCEPHSSRKAACANALLPGEVRSLADAFLAGSTVKAQDKI